MSTPLFQQGQTQLRQKKYADAIATFTQVLKADPFSVDAYCQRGLAHYDSGNIYAAIEDYGKALEINPQSAKAYYCRALARLSLKNVLGTLADVEQAIGCDRTYAAAYKLRGIVHRKQGDIQAAIADFKVASGLYLDQKDAEGARQCMDKIEEIRPKPPTNNAAPITTTPASHPPALSEKDYFTQILDRAKIGQLSQALSDINWVLQADPQDGKAHCCRGLVYCKQGNYPAAIADFNQALTLNFEDAITYRGRSKARLNLKDPHGAVADCNQALLLSPEDSDAYVARGNVYRAIGHNLGAIEDYTEALRLNGNNADAFFQRGLTYAQMKQNSQAIADYQRAISLFCGDEDWFNYQQVLAKLNAIQPTQATQVTEPKTAYDRLRQQLLGLVGGNQDLADGMVRRMKSNYPGRSEEWYLETVILELEQNLRD